jgi:hypothetical protein
MATARTPEQIRTELDAERTELAEAVEQLRGELGEATNITGKLKANLPIAAGAAASAGFMFAGGFGATMHYLARRGRGNAEMRRVGRRSIRNHG